MTQKDTETHCTKCAARIRSAAMERIESLMIPCYGGNKLLLAKDLKALRDGEITGHEKSCNKEI